jgi:hypothetical protein
LKILRRSFLARHRALARAVGEVVAALARLLMAGEHLAGFVDPVELPTRETFTDTGLWLTSGIAASRPQREHARHVLSRWHRSAPE